MPAVEAGGLDDTVINKMSHENAMRHFRFDPFSVSPRDECTVAALRKNAEGWDVSVQSRGIKASATGAADLARFSSSADD